MSHTGLRTWIVASVVSACSSGPEARGDVRVDVVARGLVTPWSIAVAPDGRLFVTERRGRVRVIVRDSLVEQPWATLPALDATAQRAETGLMGLTLDPNFAENPYVYVCYTERKDDGAVVNRVARLRERDGHGGDVEVLLDGIPANLYHDGCRLKVGPDSKLYITTGDAYLNAPAQDQSSLAGKVLRVNLDGSVPADNPTPGSPVWSLGHRNPQGLAWDPRTRLAVLVEHGSGAGDEINILERGANYGWPTEQGAVAKPAFRNPALVLHAAPAGAAFLPALASADTSYLIVATLSGNRLIELAVHGRDVSIAKDPVLDGYGRFRDVVEGPEGSVYVSTSNRDGRGRPSRDDDRILRVWLRR